MYGTLLVMLLAVTLEVTSYANPGNQNCDLEIEKLRLKLLQIYEEMLNNTCTYNSEISKEVVKELIDEAFLELPVNEKLQQATQNKFGDIEKKVNQLEAQLNSSVETVTGLIQTITSLQVNQKSDAVHSEVNQEMIKGFVQDTLSQLHITERLPTQVNQMREEIDQAVDKIDEHEQALSSLQENLESDAVHSEVNQEMIKSLVHDTLSELHITEKLPTQFNQMREKIDQAVDQIAEISSLQVNQQSDGVAFSVYLTGGDYTGENEPIPFTGVYTNRGSHFSTTTHKFSCPLHGVYVFIYSIYSEYIRGGQYSSAALYVDGSRRTDVYSRESDPDHSSAHQSATGIILECRAQQQVWLGNHRTNNWIWGDGSGDTVFSGYLLHTV